MDDFEYQLQQEEIERQKLTTTSDTNKHNQDTCGEAGASSSTTYVDPNDGTVYEWDYEKRAWFPKVDEDFIATYQASYGSHQLDLSQPSLPVEEVEVKEQKRKLEAAMSAEERKQFNKEQKKQKRKLAAEKQKNMSWFDMDEDRNTNVYVSGLPLNMTEAEFETLMAKYGLIAMEPGTNKLKLKLYKDDNGNVKGDGLCCYIKRESVELALEILDGMTIGNTTVSVEPAKFQQKGNFDPKKRKKLNLKMKNKLKEQQEKLFSWRPEKLRGERPKSDSTVVIKNVFSLDEFFENAARLFDIEEDMKQECSKYGNVKKVTVYDNNPEGVVLVKFGEPEEADDCVTMMNYRIFKNRQLRASTWDGKTKYRVEEGHDDQEKRLASWTQFLERDDDHADGDAKPSSSDGAINVTSAGE